MPAPTFTAPYEPPRRPFDARRSLQLDALIVQLDAQPGRIARTALKLQKRYLEYRAHVIVGGAHHG